MNDLTGLDWSSKPSNNQRPNNYTAFNTLRPTPPDSGRVSPLLSPKVPSKPNTPVNDSFSNLVSFSSGGANKNLSLQDKQKKLSDLKLQQHGRQGQSQYTGVDDSIWNSLGSGRSTPGLPPDGPNQLRSPHPPQEEDEDLFAAFNVPKNVPNNGTSRATEPSNSRLDDDDDDDPFGLSEFEARAKHARPGQGDQKVQAQVSLEDDDVLGLLGRPVSEFPPSRKESPKLKTENELVHPQERAVAELVDMGFPAEKARRALETTESGLDVQAAVGWLLNQAHSEAQTRSRNTSGSQDKNARISRPRQTQEDPVMPSRREKTGTPSNEAAQMASEFSATFLKTAGSLWKQGQKKFQQAVQDLNSDSESSQPKWMRDASPVARASPRPQRRNDQESELPGRQQESGAERQDVSVTDEALMLEGHRPEKPSRPVRKARPEPLFDSSRDTSRDHSPAVPSRLRENHSPQPLQSLQQQAPRPRQQPPASRAILNRQAADEQASQAYVSSARRRKPAASAPVESDLLESASRGAMQLSSVPKPAPLTLSQPPRPVKPTLVQVRPQAPARNIPSVSAISLKASHVDREAGNEHFRRGDYASAHQSYTKAFTYLPASHPIMMILLTNRALTAIKIGEPKIAVEDADNVIALIGPSKGESETVDLTNGDMPKPMRDYYGKALMRKAEALEHMEKWSEAAAVWREAVESGHGGATAIQGRQRAENAAKPKPTAIVTVKRAAPERSSAKSAAVLRAGAQAEKAAISKLRAQNAAAEKLDDERFLLSDTVDTKLNNWRGGKQDNLRALLGSLETVLWPEAGWKKISMADLVLPNKVKIQYMKGIAKVHPDKIPTTATTEQRMIAGAVFSTLNEAWDKFKRENNL